MRQSIIVIGPGAWGQALAITCHRANPRQSIHIIGKKGQDVTGEQIAPEVNSIQQISYSNVLSSVLKVHTPVIIATPSHAITDTLTALKNLNHCGHILCTAKGLIDNDDVFYPHELYNKMNPKTRSFSYLYGPTLADEVLENLPTQALLASTSKKSQDFWQNELHSDHFQTLVSQDMRGLAWCSVFKNIVAILSGCMKACNLGYNAQALLVTHATRELKSLIKDNQGCEKTAYSLAGLGDIVLSATSGQSRNFKYGHSIVKQTVPPKKLPEGILNLKRLQKRIHALKSKKLTLFTLAQDCITQPKQCRALLIQWLKGQVSAAI
ncbi:MAG: hypothetical protein CMF43_04850 [Legionellales bacterium]|jgi:glycerol-3-phosphate dehydrogenase (NAD(P)+)|nr:hypothetical protein [Legionellales bacterium]|tara:strand:- start:6715 stop:7683 length:969 start_codon:yes stop_codon:yes gene_type:complete